MRELPYFKFYPGEWVTGDVTDCSMEAQGLFINICVLYWMKGCNMSLTRVQRKFDTCLTELEEILRDDIFTVNGDDISIDFLDEQFEQFEKLRKDKSRAGKASAKKRKINTRSTPVQHVVNKEEKIREDKKREEKNINIPALEDFIKYAKGQKKEVSEEAVRLKYSAWVTNDWKDGNDKAIKNWKSKLLNTLQYLPSDKPEQKKNLYPGYKDSSFD